MNLIDNWEEYKQKAKDVGYKLLVGIFGTNQNGWGCED